jgi:hypothetical protein
VVYHEMRWTVEFTTFPRNTLRRVDALRLIRPCPLFPTWMTATLPCVAMRDGPPGLCYTLQGDVIAEPFEGLHRPLALLCLLSRLEVRVPCLLIERPLG